MTLETQLRSIFVVAWKPDLEKLFWSFSVLIVLQTIAFADEYFKFKLLVILAYKFQTLLNPLQLHFCKDLIHNQTLNEVFLICFVSPRKQIYCICTESSLFIINLF